MKNAQISLIITCKLWYKADRRENKVLLYNTWSVEPYIYPYFLNKGIINASHPSYLLCEYNSYLEEVDGRLPGKHQHWVNDPVPLWHLYDHKMPRKQGQAGGTALEIKPRLSHLNTVITQR